jgi:formylglycine-generating enzyme required for sulfatase activity
MRLFISYLREEKAYCVQVAEHLGSAHEIWYDSRLHAGQLWWEEIVRSLEWCEGFIYLISPDSVKSPNCRRELQMALEMERHIFPVLITEDAEIPEEIAHLHYFDMREGITSIAISRLLADIHTAEIADLNRAAQARESAAAITQPRRGTREIDALTVDVNEPIDADNIDAIVERATTALQKEQFDEAYALVQRAIESRVRPRYIDLEQLLREAEAGRQEKTKRASIGREYAAIAHLVKLGRTHSYGCTAYAAFMADNPDFPDELGLSGLCGLEPASPPVETAPILAAAVVQEASVPEVVADAPAAEAEASFSLPLLEWCGIPEGMLRVNLERDRKRVASKLHVPAFQISKYPVTQAQFAAFVNDPNGYDNAAWWGFSAEAQASRSARSKPQRTRFQGDDRPREMVNWFEAMAFCFWLSEKLGKKVTLPLRQQWIRAGRGDDERLYPWGDQFSVECANMHDSRINETTPVTRYPGGASPYGVMDMAGNCWEYCLNSGFEDATITGDGMRALHGGSYLSRSNLGQVTALITLAPGSAHHNIGFRLAIND